MFYSDPALSQYIGHIACVKIYMFLNSWPTLALPILKKKKKILHEIHIPIEILKFYCIKIFDIYRRYSHIITYLYVSYAEELQRNELIRDPG